MRTKQRNSHEGRKEGMVLRRVRWYGISMSSFASSFSDIAGFGDLAGASTHPSKACSRSCVMKSEDLSRR